MKIKKIINLILGAIIVTAASITGYYYLNSPTTKVEQQHIIDNSQLYKKIKYALERPFKVSTKNLGKYNLGVLEIMYQRIKPISSNIVIKYMEKFESLKALKSGENKYNVLFGDRTTNEIFENNTVTIEVNEIYDEANEEDIDHKNENNHNGEDCDEDDEECWSSSEDEEDDFLEFDELIDKLENDGVDAESLTKEDLTSDAYYLIRSEVEEYNSYVNIELSENNEETLKYWGDDNIVLCELSELTDSEDEEPTIVKVKLINVQNSSISSDYERLEQLQLFLDENSEIDASSLSEEDDPSIAFDLIQEFLDVNDQSENYDEIQWTDYDNWDDTINEENEDNDNIPELIGGDNDVDITFIIGEEKLNVTITLLNIQVLQTEYQIINQIIKLFATPLKSLKLNTLINQDFLLEYINDQIKKISPNYSAKFPYNTDNSLLKAGEHSFRIEIYKKTEYEEKKINPYNPFSDYEENQEESTSDDDEIYGSAVIVDKQKIKSDLLHIAKTIEYDPINKSDLESYVSDSENNNSKIWKRVEDFLVIHANKIARNKLNLPMKVVVKLTFNDSIDIKTAINSNLDKIWKSIFPKELLNPQLNNNKPDSNSSRIYETFKKEFSQSFNINIHNSTKDEYDENKLKLLLEAGVTIPLLKERTTYLTTLAVLNIWIKTLGYKNTTLKFNSLNENPTHSFLSSINLQNFNLIQLGSNEMNLKYNINGKEIQVNANIICDNEKTIKEATDLDDNDDDEDEKLEEDLKEIIDLFEKGIPAGVLSTTDNMKKALNFFTHEAHNINKKAKVSFQSKPTSEQVIGEDEKDQKTKTFKLKVKIKFISAKTDHAKIVNLKNEENNVKDTFEQIKGYLKKGVSTKYQSKENFTTSMHQKDVLVELEKMAHSIDPHSSVHIENMAHANSLLTEGHILMQVVLRVDNLKEKIEVPITDIKKELIDAKKELISIKKYLKKRQLDGSNLSAYQRFRDTYSTIINEVNTLNKDVEISVIEGGKLLKEGENTIQIELNLNNEKEAAVANVKNVKISNDKILILIKKIRANMTNYLKAKKIQVNDNVQAIVNKLLSEGKKEISDDQIVLKESYSPKKLDSKISPHFDFYLQFKNKHYNFSVTISKVRPDVVKSNQIEEEKKEKLAKEAEARRKEAERNKKLEKEEREKAEKIRNEEKAKEKGIEKEKKEKTEEKRKKEIEQAEKWAKEAKEKAQKAKKAKKRGKNSSR